MRAHSALFLKDAISDNRLSPESKSTVKTFPHTLIRASAGTGKTYQLSNRFIGLARAGAPPDQILAATFARKAAGEILSRVVTRVAGAINNPAQLQKLRESIGDATLDRDGCLTLLQKVIRRLHRLRIGTLDSFFVQLAGMFGLELGLPPGWRIGEELDDRRIRAEAIQSVLQSETRTDLLTLMNLLFKGEARRSITGQIADIVDDLYDVYRDTTIDAWQGPPRPVPQTKSDVAAAVANLHAVGPFSGKQLNDAWIKDCEHAGREAWKEFLGGTIAKNIAAGKAKFGRTALEQSVLDAYLPLINHAGAVLVNQLIDQTEGTWQLLDKFHRAYQAHKADERSLRFDDVTRALADGLRDGRIAEVAYRLDSQLAHLLLDEFQDTSLAQWQVLRPFVERVAAADGSRSFFCVGDVKQAIYGWRGGVSEVFDAVRVTVPGIVESSLEESHRSSPVIIEAVNGVLGHLSGNGALDDFSDVVSLWNERYKTHTTAKTTLAGYCRLATAPQSADPKQQWTTTLQYAAAEVARLSAAAQGRSVGVLVRTNNAVARLIYELRSRHKQIASEEGGNPLTDSIAVQVVLSLLRLADHPGDTIARFHVATSPLGPQVGLTEDADEVTTQNVAAHIRESLISRGYGATLYDWVEKLSPACDGRELSRLIQLVELGYAWEGVATLRADDFVRFVEAKRVEDPTTADVRVMTVHQAKGLQFDIVVLPELDKQLQGQAPPIVVDRDSPVGAVRRVCRYANKVLQPFLPVEYQSMFANWPTRLVNESLCLLYVALTRPVHALHAIIAPSANSEKSPRKTFAGVLRSAWTDGCPVAPERTLFEMGDANWHEKQPAPPRELPKPQAEPLAVRLKESAGRRRRGLDPQSPSGLEGGNRVYLGNRWRKDSAEAMDRGTLVHAWFEQISWLDDGLPADDDLEKTARKLTPAGFDLPAEIAAFRRILERSSVRRALSRAAYEKPTELGIEKMVCAELLKSAITLDVWRERAFALREDDALLTGAIDRVVLLFHGSRVVAADIVDFKTDYVDESNLASKVEYYRPQIDAYRRAVVRLTGLDSFRVSARLLFVEAGIVRVVA